MEVYEIREGFKPRQGWFGVFSMNCAAKTFAQWVKLLWETIEIIGQEPKVILTALKLKLL